MSGPRRAIARRIGAACLLALLGTSLTGCIVAPGPGGGGWCYNHPYRCGW